MREQLRDRNLSHIGCFFGVVIGLSGGIILAGALAVHSVATLVVLLVWIGLVLALGGIGYALGNAMSSPAARLRRRSDAE